MKKWMSVSVLVVALLLVEAIPSEAWGHGWRGGPVVGARVLVGFGPAFWWGPPLPYWYSPPPYYVYTPPPIVVQQPPVYVQQPAPAPLPPAPGPGASAPPQSYWYYCASAKAYYPAVQTCPEPWIKVPPRPEERARREDGDR